MAADVTVRTIDNIADPKAARPGTGLRADIQGMRALAVGAVLAYHLWPGAVTGGYVGVDVFLVISGFLITSHLLREQPTTWRAVGRFWGRRIRRLLPASALVILTTVGIGALVLPSTQLIRTGQDAIASALYAQNWLLAESATDYLSADEAPTALRHYWSLAVEEQYYLVWPVVVGLTVLLARRIGRIDVTRTTQIGLGILIGAVGVGSLAWSAHLTAVNPAAAYYVTWTRVWELALGGALALVVSTGRTVPAQWAAPLAGAGLVAVVGSVVAFNAQTPFPGTTALVPTLGTVAVIAAAAPATAWTTRLLGKRPAQLLGNVSYSTYLWHWPLIVLVPFAVHRHLSWWELVLVALASVGLAWVTTRWFEDPIRRSRWLSRSPWLTVGLLVLCTATGAVAGTVLSRAAAVRADRETAAANAAAAAHPDCFGAGSALSGADCSVADHQLWMTPMEAQGDKSVLYADNCWNDPPYATRRTCTYGEPDAPVRIALIGNSHAGHWFTPIEQVAADRGWEVTTYVASSCYPVDVDLHYPNPEAIEGCSAWNDWVRTQVAEQSYDLVVMSARTDQHMEDVPEASELDVAAEAFARELTAITTTGAQVLVIRDTPNFSGSVPDCVASAPDQDCTIPQAEGLERDPLAEAARADTSGQVSLLDVTDLLCRDGTCHGVVGGAIVMFDHGHLTSTFASSLRPVVEPALDAALAGKRS